MGLPKGKFTHQTKQPNFEVRCNFKFEFWWEAAEDMSAKCGIHKVQFYTFCYIV
jgi:hypothetical protein